MDSITVSSTGQVVRFEVKKITPSRSIANGTALLVAVLGVVSRNFLKLGIPGRYWELLDFLSVDFFLGTLPGKTACRQVPHIENSLPRLHYKHARDH